MGRAVRACDRGVQWARRTILEPAPPAALPAGVGATSGLPVRISLIGRPGADRDLLALGIDLQRDLGIPEPPIGADTHA